MDTHRIILMKIKKCVKAVQSDSDIPSISKEVSGCTIKVNARDPSLVDENARSYLTENKVVNWCRTIAPLYPLKIGEGRGGPRFLQLLSFLMWSFYDGVEFLARSLYVAIEEKVDTPMKMRWIQQRLRRNQTVHNRDWDEIIRSMHSNEIELRGFTSIPFPQPIHVFASANILNRPIIIVESSDKRYMPNWNSSTEPSNFAGIYLPLLRDPQECVRSPLVFAQHDGVLHALVGGQDTGSQSLFEIGIDAIPLVDSNLEPLEVQFLADSELRNGNNFLMKYLDVTEVNCTTSDSISQVLAARITYKTLDLSSESGAVNNQPNHMNNQVNAGHVNGVIIPPQAPLNVIQHPAPVRGISVHNVDPSAPSASIVTFNEEMGILPIEEQYHTSMLGVKCEFQNCGLYQSIRTAPFCYLHASNAAARQVGIAATALPPVTVVASAGAAVVGLATGVGAAVEGVGAYGGGAPQYGVGTTAIQANYVLNNQGDVYHPSMIEEFCSYPNCQYYKSIHTAPYCHDHAGYGRTRPVVTTAGPVWLGGVVYSRPTIHVSNNEAAVYQTSLMEELCAHHGCNNHASSNTAPMCHEHAMSRERINLVGAGVAEVVICTNGMRENTTVSEPRVDVQFAGMLEDLELRPKRTAAMCKKSGCANFGNSKCQGYCHTCFMDNAGARS